MARTRSSLEIPSKGRRCAPQGTGNLALRPAPSPYHTVTTRCLSLPMTFVSPGTRWHSSLPLRTNSHTIFARRFTGSLLVARKWTNPHGPDGGVHRIWRLPRELRVHLPAVLERNSNGLAGKNTGLPAGAAAPECDGDLLLAERSAVARCLASPGCASAPATEAPGERARWLDGAIGAVAGWVVEPTRGAPSAPAVDPDLPPHLATMASLTALMPHH